MSCERKIISSKIHSRSWLRFPSKTAIQIDNPAKGGKRFHYKTTLDKRPYFEKCSHLKVLFHT
jgi:hypothetical protein